MRCKQVQAGFSEWQEQRLETRLANRLRAHLEECPACAREWALFQATWQLLHRLPEVEPPPDFVERTLAALPLSSPSARRESGGFWNVVGRWAWVGATAVLLLALGLAARWRTPGEETGPVELVEGPAALHGEAPSIPLEEPSLPQRVPATARPSPPEKEGKETPERSRARQDGKKTAPPSQSRPSPEKRLVEVRPEPSLPSEKKREPVTPVPDPYQGALARAKDLLERGRAREAIAELEERVAGAPSEALQAAGYRQLAQAYQADYRLEDALRAQAQAKQLAPEVALPLPGSSLAEGGEEALAQQVLAEARALLAEGQSDEAARLSQSLLTNDVGATAQQAAAVALIARCQAAQQQPELEQITLTRLAQQFPHSEPATEALWRVASAQEQAGNAGAAAQTYQTLLAQLPAEKEELVLRARALKRAADLAARSGGDPQAVAAQYSAARDTLKRAQREAKDVPQVRDGRVLLEIAQVQEALREKPKAIETYVEVIRNHPDTDSAREAEARLEELI